MPPCMCEALQMNCQIITGYKGSKEAGLAVMNGEVDALTISEGSGIEYAQGGTRQGDRRHRQQALAVRAQRADCSTRRSSSPPERKWCARLPAQHQGLRPRDGGAARPARRTGWPICSRSGARSSTIPTVKAEGAKHPAPDQLRGAGASSNADRARHLLETSAGRQASKDVNEVLLKKYSLRRSCACRGP